MKNQKQKQSVYELITAQVIENLKSAGSWKKMWDIPQPISLMGRRYNGVNFLLLARSKFASPVWGTFNQVRQNGGAVKKGEKATPVVFWKKLSYTLEDKQGNTITKEDGTPETKTTFYLRYYYVFNTDQCSFDEIGQKKIAELSRVSESINNERFTPADEIVQTMPAVPEIEHGNFNPCYIPSLDTVRLPELKNFHNSVAYYEALFHELVHSTGHERRLNRDMTGHAKSHAYSKEELVAELGAAFLCTIANLDTDMDNHAAYIKGWLSVLQDNPKWITWAASQAQKACEFICPALKEQEAAVAVAS